MTAEELVRVGYTAWSNRDWEAFAAVLHPEVEWHTSTLFPGIEPVYEGREATMGFLREFSTSWEEISAQPEEVRAIPGGVLVRVRFRARGRGGVEVDRRFGHRFEVEEDHVRRVFTYAGWDESLSALGLS